jgi:hypothetical protein
MSGLIEFLKGKKTYIIGFCVAGATFALNVGWIDEGTYQTVLGFLGAGGLLALRAGLSK